MPNYTKATDLEVGTEVALIDYDSFSENSHITKAKVVKILATRVDVELPSGRVQRWVVDKYGEIHTPEGGDRYRSPYFARGDDRRVVVAEARNRRFKEHNAANAAIAAYQAKGRHVTTADIEELMGALGVYKDIRQELAGF